MTHAAIAPDFSVLRSGMEYVNAVDVKEQLLSLRLYTSHGRIAPM
jgi:hypothetical protein